MVNHEIQRGIVGQCAQSFGHTHELGRIHLFEIRIIVKQSKGIVLVIEIPEFSAYCTAILHAFQRLIDTVERENPLSTLAPKNFGLLPCE